MSYITEAYDKSDAIIFDQSDSSQLPFVSRRLGRAQLLDIYFMDVNSTFRQDNKELIIYDQDAINRQITTILSTPLRSEDFEPTFGSLLPYRLFDPIGNITAYLLRSDTIDAIGTWMKGRITMNMAQTDVSIINDNPDYEGYIITMPYRINRTNSVVTYSMAYLR